MCAFLFDSHIHTISCFFRELGIETLSNCKDEQNELFKLAQTMFDTKLPPGVVMLQPFAEDSSIKKVAVQVCIRFLVLAMGCPIS